MRAYLWAYDKAIKSPQLYRLEAFRCARLDLQANPRGIVVVTIICYFISINTLAINGGESTICGKRLKLPPPPPLPPPLPPQLSNRQVRAERVE